MKRRAQAETRTEAPHGEYKHRIIDHAVRYVDGKVDTNSMGNFWSPLKRGLNRTYVSVEPFHLFRYLDERELRYDHRGSKANPVNDADRLRLPFAKLSANGSPTRNSLARRKGKCNHF